MSESILLMKKIIPLSLFTAATQLSAETGLTIYNQNIAVVRETIPLKLEQGEISISFDQATAQVRADSVVLRDPAGKVNFTILEQGYRNDPVTEGLLLDHFEGTTIQFEKSLPDGTIKTVEGKIVRSGYGGGRKSSPIIESDGKMQFALPGRPVFPALGEDSILRPTLSWKIDSEAAATLDAQLSYLSSGFNWQATYNIIAPEKGETVSLTGWVTLTNTSGTDFKDAQIKLVAGDVNVTRPEAAAHLGFSGGMRAKSRNRENKVTEKSFDDFHIYGLPRKIDLRDQETKQVEFLRSDAVKARKVYIYEPTQNRFYGGWNFNRSNETWPSEVATFWEFDNIRENGLGVPLPAGVMRFYRSDNADGNLEFVGENRIPHTPQKESVRLQTGTSFDLVGEKLITNFKASSNEKWARESMKITVKNRSKEEKTIIIREPLWRWSNWKIENPSMKFKKVDSRTIKFSVTLAPDAVKEITYTAFYSSEPQ